MKLKVAAIINRRVFLSRFWLCADLRNWTMVLACLSAAASAQGGLPPFLSQPDEPSGGSPVGFARLDTTFNGSGIRTEGIGGGNDQGSAAALQADGKIVVAASTSVNTFSIYVDSDIVVVRYNPDGSVDATFGTGCRLEGSTIYNAYRATSIVVQPDGKILVGGVHDQKPGDRKSA